MLFYTYPDFDVERSRLVVHLEYLNTLIMPRKLLCGLALGSRFSMNVTGFL